MITIITIAPPAITTIVMISPSGGAVAVAIVVVLSEVVDNLSNLVGLLRATYYY